MGFKLNNKPPLTIKQVKSYWNDVRNQVESELWLGVEAEMPECRQIDSNSH